MHSTEGIECVKVFLFLQVCLMEVQGFRLDLLGVWKRHHHVVDDVVVLGEGGGVPHHARKLHCLLGAYGVVCHIINFCINVLLLISTPKKYFYFHIKVFSIAGSVQTLE